MHEVISVEVLDNYKLKVEFENGEQRLKDITNLINKPAFKQLLKYNIFRKVKVIDGAITWQLDNGDEIDLCPDNTYETSEPFDPHK
jgi:hypothetical protein